MLKLNLSPVRSDEFRRVVKWNHPVLSIEDIIIADGRVDSGEYDLSLLDDGATAQHPALGTVTRTGDDYECTVRLPHGPNAPHETRFPEPITVTEDGPIELPAYDSPEEADDDLAE